MLKTERVAQETAYFQLILLDASTDNSFLGGKYLTQICSTNWNRMAS